VWGTGWRGAGIWIDIFLGALFQNTGFKGLAGFGYGVIRPKY
jgi:hypothetical protein